MKNKQGKPVLEIKGQTIAPQLTDDYQCECGSDSIGLSVHSTYCPKYNES